MTLSFAAKFHSLSEGVRVITLDEQHCQIETALTGGSAELDLSLVEAGIWKEYEYLTADFYHECHDVLVIIFTFQDHAGRSISVHYGLLPHTRTRLCFPLTALNGEKLFLDRYPGVLQSVLRGDSFVDRSRIAGLSVSTIPSVSARHFEMSGLKLTRTEPEFHYAPVSYIDELGQLSWKEWQGKTCLPEKWHPHLKREAPFQFTCNSIATVQSGGWRLWFLIRKLHQSGNESGLLSRLLSVTLQICQDSFLEASTGYGYVEDALWRRSCLTLMSSYDIPLGVIWKWFLDHDELSKRMEKHKLVFITHVAQHEPELIYDQLQQTDKVNQLIMSAHLLIVKNENDITTIWFEHELMLWVENEMMRDSQTLTFAVEGMQAIRSDFSRRYQVFDRESGVEISFIRRMA